MPAGGGGGSQTRLTLNSCFLPENLPVFQEAWSTLGHLKDRRALPLGCWPGRMAGKDALSLPMAWGTLAQAELSQPLSFRPFVPSGAIQASWEMGKTPSSCATPGICAASFMHAACGLQAGACNRDLEESAARKGSPAEEMAPGWILKQMQQVSEVGKYSENDDHIPQRAERG